MLGLPYATNCALKASIAAFSRSFAFSGEFRIVANLLQDVIAGARRNSMSSLRKRTTSETGTSSRKPLATSVDSQCLVLEGKRVLTALLKQLGHCSAAVQLILGSFIQVGTELGKRLELAVCSEVEAQRTRNRFDGLGLRGATNAGYRDTNVNSGALALIEQVGRADKSDRR